MSRGHRQRNVFDSDSQDSEFSRIDADEEPSEEFEEDIHQQGYDNNEEDDDNEGSNHRKRTRSRINYNEDEFLPKIEDGEEEEEEKENSSSNKKRRNLDDDEFDPINDKVEDEYEDDNLSEDYDDDEFRKPKRNRGFIVKDDSEEDDGDFRIHKAHRTFKRGTRASTRLAKLYSDDEHRPLTLEDEVKDLANDSPLNSPKRNLRLRKEVNYTLPPPDLTEVQIDDLNGASSPRRRGGRYGGASGINGFGNISSQVRRLFPTQGPFGGSDVVSIFSKGSTMATIGNVESSDSEDENDLVKPVNPNDMSNIVTAQLNNGPNIQGKKKNTLADTDPLGIDTNIDFSVIGGLDNYISQLKEMITLPLLYPEVYSKFHITPPRGVLFHGPPGTGKTLMARALAASCSSQDQKITFFMRKGADCLSKWVGEAERHLRLLFEEAKQNQPSIIFFDEIDGLAPVRSSKQEQIHASIVSTLLALMDGMDNRGQVIIIGATNRPDSIDPALRRPGRFDREFYFPLPDLNAREDILKIHMRKWENKLNASFVKELALLTKGYGGADLRSLCTESALNSIQRTYPQIYKSKDKLKININKINVNASDFTRALKKVIPNSARSTSSVNQPLPKHLSPLLNKQLNEILEKLRNLIPIAKPLSLLEESEYVSTNNNFESQQVINTIETMRVFKPRIGISSENGQGIKYISNAVLNNFEGFTVQILDLSKIFSDSSISIENLLIQIISELKRHKPSILFVPDVIGLLNTISPTFKSTLKYLLRGINNNDKILILCEIEGKLTDDILDELEFVFELTNESIISIRNCLPNERIEFFSDLWKCIFKTPFEYNDISIRPKRKLKELKVIKKTLKNDDDNEDDNKQKRKELLKNDMSLKNSLKIKLSGLMDLFKIRYKRFKKPIIDDGLLIHLFDENNHNLFNEESRYKVEDNMILERDTGKKFFNIDLDVIEERLWNGFYSEPKQFLNDLNMILKDSLMSRDRDRILKANEMIAHASVGIEEIEAQFPQLAEQWKAMGKRERVKQKENLKKLLENGTVNKDDNNNDIELVIEENGEGKQVQAQLIPIENNNNNNNNTINSKTDQLLTFNDVNIKPIEICEPLEKVDLEKKTVQEEKEEEEKEKEEQEQGQEEEDSPDEEFELPKQEITINEEILGKLEGQLISSTEGKNISSLERIYGHLMKLIWNHRLELDKRNLIAEMQSYISSI